MGKVTVSIDDKHLSAIHEVAANLQEQGLQVQSVLEGVGVITGSVPDEQRHTLLNVAGVTSVDPDLDVQLPPPGEPQ